jgi:hypothetical protein
VSTTTSTLVADLHEDLGLADEGGPTHVHVCS